MRLEDGDAWLALDDGLHPSWGNLTPRTRAKVISILRDFFAFEVREGRITANPALPIFRPRQREVAREPSPPRT